VQFCYNGLSGAGWWIEAEWIGGSRTNAPETRRGQAQVSDDLPKATIACELNSLWQERLGGSRLTPLRAVLFGARGIRLALRRSFPRFP
jgi:hypothetical protein